MKMDKSPMMFEKRKTRLSLTKRNKDAASPKTPCRLRTSPARVDTPPNAARSAVGQPASHSTPLNRYKRTCFAEESPSQDYDSDPPASLPCSQADFAHIIDVDWQWEKQCPNITKTVRNNIRQPRRIEVSSRPVPPATRQLPQKSFPPRSPESDQKKGFYKFKEELMQNFQNARDSGGSSPLTDFEQFDELDSSLKENDTKNFICDSNIRKRIILNGIIDEKISGKKEAETKKIIEMKIANKREIEKQQQPVETQRSSLRIETKSVSNPTLKTSTVPQLESKMIVEPAKQTTEVNLLDDSDDDGLLVLCSQKVEEQINQNVVNPKLKAIPKESAFENDSFDDIFLSIPIDDDKLFQSIPAGQTNQCRSPLVRYNSMPAKSPSAPTKQPPDAKTGNISFSRHNSMPVSDKPIVKTAESAASVKRLCTAEEIKKKRLEAIQRLEANRRKAALQKTGTATNSEANKLKSSILNLKNVNR